MIDKCHDNSEKFDFYVNKVIENNWSRAVLLNFLETDLYERQGQAITNFQYTLPKGTGDLAQEITKAPYNFDFVAIRQGYTDGYITLVHHPGEGQYKIPNYNRTLRREQMVGKLLFGTYCVVWGIIGIALFNWVMGM